MVFERSDSQIDSFEKLFNLLQLEIKKYSKVSFIGNSMGGYAAILLGVLLNVDEVVVFSPQTFIDSFHRFIYFDMRWNVQLNRLHKLGYHDNYYDLKHLLKTTSYSTSINLHYSADNRLDRLHSKRLKNIKNVNLFQYPVGGHSLVKNLRNTGMLHEIIKEL